MTYRESEWNGFKRLDFEFRERAAIVVLNENGDPARKWLFKTEYFDAFQQAELEMVRRGYNLAYISSRSRWAPDEETDIKAEFCDFLTKEFGFCEKCVPVGMSCGGLQAARLAQEHPEKVAAIYFDAPVLNILSMAGLGALDCAPDMWEELKNTFGFSKTTIVNFRRSPIDFLDVLTDNNIPVILIYGNADREVIFEENGKVLADHYMKHSAPIKVIGKSMCGHHPHGLPNPGIIADFIELYY